VSGWKKATAGAALLTAVAGGLPWVAGCGSAPIICAGQCQSPFELMVTLKPGTSPGAASSELRQCNRDDANVINVVKGSKNGQPGAAIYTHSMSKSRPDRLQKCLTAEPHVLSAAWPD
jgi:hypothetical protein